ncbi:MAG: hypothetical protein ABII82_20835 [Verrucomicrobiota bacterium]
MCCNRLRESRSGRTAGRFRRLCATALGIAGLGHGGLFAAIISITDATSSFTAINPTYTLQDPANDQQTGDKAADFVSTSTTPGFYMKFGEIGGVDMVMFRFHFQDYRKQATFNGSIRLGMDADSDGDIDLFFGSHEGGGQNGSGISFQDPGTGLNVSPSTTSLGGNYGTVALVSSGANANYGYTALTGVTGVGAQVTFAISFQSIADALVAAGTAPGVTLTPESIVRFLAFTAQQTAANSINQDILGVNGGYNSTVRFDAPGGGFTDYIDSTGAPVPELGSFAYAAGFLFAGLGIRRRRRPAP